MSEAQKKYRPERDRARMKKYMADKRSKDRAGYSSLTVTEWRKAMALLEMDELAPK